MKGAHFNHEMFRIVMKKTLALILLASLILSAASCGSGETPSGNTETSAPSSGDTSGEETVDENSRDAVKSSIPADLKFTGETVTVLTRDKEEFINEFQADEENGDTMNDAIYARNAKVEDQLGIDINVISRNGEYGQHTQFNSDVVKEVMSGDTEYDVISYYAYAMPMIARQNVLYNLNDLDNLDLTKPWWHQKFIENAEIYGKLYSVAGDIDLTTVTYRSALFFNKDLKESYIPDEDLYKKVLDGTFTQEYLIGITKDIYQDIDGDQKKSEGDFYGFDANNGLDPFPVGGNFTYTKKTSDGGYEWDMVSEHNVTLIERFYDMYNGNNGIYFIDKADDNRFIQNQCIFTISSLSMTEKLRDMKEEYGILPMPKFDEKQDQYYSIANDNFSLIAVPTTVKNPALTGAFLELMGEYSYKIVTPKYYEVAMKGKYLRDDESCQMFDIIVGQTWYDFANINTSVLGDPVFITRQAQYHYKNLNYVSNWASREAELEGTLTELLNEYKG